MRISILVYLFPTIFATKETHSTMCRIDNRKYLVRWICVIMLMLIQFDAYGYDALNAMTQEAEYVSLYEETVDTNTEQTEWSDYRYRVVKQRAELKFTAIAQGAVTTFLSDSVTKPIHLFIHATPLGAIASHVNLLYCTFLI